MQPIDLSPRVVILQWFTISEETAAPQNVIVSKRNLWNKFRAGNAIPSRAVTCDSLPSTHKFSCSFSREIRKVFHRLPCFSIHTYIYIYIVDRGITSHPFVLFFSIQYELVIVIFPPFLKINELTDTKWRLLHWWKWILFYLLFFYFI